MDFHEPRVSISTVSRVINNSPLVKEKNKKRVLEAIEQLNYRPSVLAQRLATGKSNVVALVIPRYEASSIRSTRWSSSAASARLPPRLSWTCSCTCRTAAQT